MESIDHAIANFSFHLFRDPAHSLREFRRALRRGGQIVLVECWEGRALVYNDDPEQWFYDGGGGISLSESQADIQLHRISTKIG